MVNYFIFLIMIQKSKTIKEKIDKFNYVNIKNFCLAKSPKDLYENV